MTTKRFNGKAIYQPSGKAAEYSGWACNFFTGCSNDCEYCYCKRGVMKHVWNTEPKLKKCFKNKTHAIEMFEKELTANLSELKRAGIFFSFTTDPMIPGQTFELTMCALAITFANDVPVQILTKRVDWMDDYILLIFHHYRDKLAVGFTLTGFDEKEQGASSNVERIEAMNVLHKLDIKTFASIEPIITPAMSRNMIEATRGFCDLYKVGVISGKSKDFYNREHMTHFWDYLAEQKRAGQKIYIKDSLLEYFNLTRENLASGWIKPDYNIFDIDLRGIEKDFPLE